MLHTHIHNQLCYIPDEGHPCERAEEVVCYALDEGDHVLLTIEAALKHTNRIEA
jgi:hypothetical protein